MTYVFIHRRTSGCSHFSRSCIRSAAGSQKGSGVPALSSLPLPYNKVAFTACCCLNHVHVRIQAACVNKMQQPHHDLRADPLVLHIIRAIIPHPSPLQKTPHTTQHPPIVSPYFVIVGSVSPFRCRTTTHMHAHAHPPTHTHTHHHAVALTLPPFHNIHPPRQLFPGLLPCRGWPARCPCRRRCQEESSRHRLRCWETCWREGRGWDPGWGLGSAPGRAAGFLCLHHQVRRRLLKKMAGRGEGGGG